MPREQRNPNNRAVVLRVVFGALPASFPQYLVAVRRQLSRALQHVTTIYSGMPLFFGTPFQPSPPLCRLHTYVGILFSFIPPVLPFTVLLTFHRVDNA